MSSIPHRCVEYDNRYSKAGGKVTAPPPTRGGAKRACLPRFVVIGTQKGGTSTLSKLMSQHHQIDRPKTKELLFFNGNNDFNIKCAPEQAKAYGKALQARRALLYNHVADRMPAFVSPSSCIIMHLPLCLFSLLFNAHPHDAPPLVLHSHVFTPLPSGGWRRSPRGPLSRRNIRGRCHSCTQDSHRRKTGRYGALLRGCAGLPRELPADEGHARHGRVVGDVPPVLVLRARRQGRAAVRAHHRDPARPDRARALAL